jgi:hypothetical protein
MRAWLPARKGREGYREAGHATGVFPWSRGLPVHRGGLPVSGAARGGQPMALSLWP